MTTPAAPYTVYTVCRQCDKPLHDKRVDAQFCSNACRYKSHNQKKKNAPRKRGVKGTTDEKRLYNNSLPV